MIEIDIREASWKLNGNCINYDAELMWPVGTTGPAEVQIQQAKAVCAECPIAAKCLEYANTNHEYYGIWGGFTEEERRELRRKTKPRMLRKASKKKKPAPYAVPTEVMKRTNQKLWSSYSKELV